MTKVTAKYYVFRDKENGEYLESYKDRGRLAFQNSYTDEIQGAITMSEEGYENKRKNSKTLLKPLALKSLKSTQLLN